MAAAVLSPMGDTNTNHSIHGSSFAEGPSSAGTNIIAVAALKDGDGNSNSDPKVMLAQKMVRALQDMGYDASAVAKVTDLVLANSRTQQASYTSYEEFTGDSSLKLASQMLAGMLGDRSVWYVNSNEPVLLLTVENAEEVSKDIVESFKEAVRQELVNVYHVLPVRVYVSDSATKSNEGIHTDEKTQKLSLTLLNVVNTEIGGPSMIQLLDHWHQEDPWHDHLLSVDAWRERDFLWRDEKRWNFQPTRSQVSSEQVPSASTEEEDKIVVSVVETTGINAEVHEEGDTVTEKQADSPEQEEESSAPIQHPAMLELSEKEATRANIDHPTWQHSESGSNLVDLVRKQALKSETTDDELDMMKPEDGQSIRNREDDFEIL